MSWMDWLLVVLVVAILAWIFMDRNSLSKVVLHQERVTATLKRYDLARRASSLVRSDRVVNGEYRRLKDQWRD